MVTHHLGLCRTQRRMLCSRAGDGIRRAATAALGWSRRRLFDGSIDMMYPFDDSMMWILYSSTADWHRCTCFLLSWIVVVIRLMYVSMCRMDGCISFDGSNFCCCDGDG